MVTHTTVLSFDLFLEVFLQVITLMFFNRCSPSLLKW